MADPSSVAARVNLMMGKLNEHLKKEIDLPYQDLTNQSADPVLFTKKDGPPITTETKYRFFSVHVEPSK